MEQRYKPTTQKQLFNQPIINNIKNWLNSITDTKKYILLLHGPVNSGKSITLSILLKSYNIINIEHDNITSDNKDFINFIPSYNQLLVNKIQKNIALIENIELIDKDKNFNNFLEFFLISKNENTPIILVCNNDATKKKYNDIITKLCSDNIVFNTIDFLKPTLYDLRKIFDNIKKDYKIDIKYEDMKDIIELSEYNISQFFHICELINLNKNECIKKFINNFKKIEKDIDLNEKMLYLTDSNIEFNTFDSFFISSDPLCISKNLYQNYLSFYNNIDNTFDIINSISQSDIFEYHIFNDQYWELYDELSIISCIIPSFYIKTTQEIKLKVFSPYKHVSYNINNSFNEIVANSTNTTYNYFYDDNLFFKFDNTFNYYLKTILTKNLEQITNYYDDFILPYKKKSVKTTTDDKYFIFFFIKNTNDTIVIKIKNCLYKLIDLIYIYKLYKITCDIEKILFLNNNIENIKDNLKYIDLSITKRFLNICSIIDTPYLIKPHVELSIKFCILEKLFEKKYNKQHKKSIYDISNMIEDLVF